MNRTSSRSSQRFSDTGLPWFASGPCICVAGLHRGATRQRSDRTILVMNWVTVDSDTDKIRVSVTATAGMRCRLPRTDVGDFAHRLPWKIAQTLMNCACDFPTMLPHSSRNES